MKRKQLARHKGRAGGDSATFARLPVEVLESPACATLHHIAFRVLVALSAQYRGRKAHGNGSLSLSRATAKTYGVHDPHALAQSLRELEARGLVLCTRLGTRTPPRAARYALGWLQIDPPESQDPHDAKESLTPRDLWRNWNTVESAPHWTVEGRPVRSIFDVGRAYKDGGHVPTRNRANV